MMDRQPGTASQQHYVPRHLLRGFLSSDPREASKEQVRVFDLRDGKPFTTKIDNIMGERRYDEWWIDDDTLLSINDGVGKVEEYIFPLITQLRQTHCLNLSPEEHSDIALLLAFQFLRAKKMREHILRMDDTLRRAIEKRGWSTDQLDGYRTPTEETIKQDHTRQQIHGLMKFTETIAEKVFFLATTPPGTSLYLGDNPVVMANNERRDPWGSIGIGVPFIQIYMPLASDLLLCAYAPEVLGDWMRKHDEAMDEARRIAFGKVTSGEIPASMMRELLDRVDASDGLNDLIKNVRSGKPVELKAGMVDSYNSLQAFYAVRWVVDSRGEFEVARQTIPKREQLQREIDRNKGDPTPLK